MMRDAADAAHPPRAGASASSHGATRSGHEAGSGEVAAPIARDREGRGTGDGDLDAEAQKKAMEEAAFDPLDPAARNVAMLAPPGASFVSAPNDVTAPKDVVRGRSLEELLPALVRKIAWAGDRNRGSVRLELGAGAYADTTLIVHAEGARVRVEVSGHEGPELDRLRSRLHARLRNHGLDVESVT